MMSGKTLPYHLLWLALAYILLPSCLSAAPLIEVLSSNRYSDDYKRKVAAELEASARAITSALNYSTDSLKLAGYSRSSDSLSAMEAELKKIQANKIIKTPPPEKPELNAPDSENSLAEKQRDDAVPTFYQRLIKSALERTESKVIYDGRYRYIKYPWGDVPKSRGVCTDVVIRSYRKLGIDLQQLVHEDIKKHFNLYPSRKKWGLRKPDTNIDHRRVFNLKVFFQRHGQTLPATYDPLDYHPGDLVTWYLGPKMPHIGIVVDKPSPEDPNRLMVVHNIGSGPKLEDILFSFPITGHYRYQPGVVTPVEPRKIILASNTTDSHRNTPNLDLETMAKYLNISASSENDINMQSNSSEDDIEFDWNAAILLNDQ